MIWRSCTRCALTWAKYDELGGAGLEPVLELLEGALPDEKATLVSKAFKQEQGEGEE